MWQASLLIFLITLVIASIVGTRARAQLLIMLRDNHPDIYHQLGRPPIWISTSMAQGIKTQKLVFSGKPKLSGKAETARQHLRQVTVIVVIAFLVESVFMMWAFGKAMIF